MRIRALTGFVAADGGHSEGEVWDASPVDAGEWLRLGLVERITPAVEEAVFPEAPETAVTRKPRR